jgi:hypothetical protein
MAATSMTVSRSPPVACATTGVPYFIAYSWLVGRKQTREMSGFAATGFNSKRQNRTTRFGFNKTGQHLFASNFKRRL